MAAGIKTVNLEAGMPSVPQARARLSSEIRVAQQSGVRVLKSAIASMAKTGAPAMNAVGSCSSACPN